MEIGTKRDIVEIALKDWASLKENQISEYEVMKKMQENSVYKDQFNLLFQLEGSQLLDRGYFCDFRGISLTNKKSWKDYGDLAVEDFIKATEYSLACSHQKVVEKNVKEYNRKFPLGFKVAEDVENMAIIDYEKSQKNKITEAEIAIKMERNDLYKNAFEKMCNNANFEYMASKGIPLTNMDFFKQCPGSMKLFSIEHTYKNFINSSSTSTIHKETIYQKFEKENGDIFPIKVEEQKALNDYNLYRKNGISDVILDDRMENSPRYLRSLKKIFNEEAKIKINNPKEREGYIESKINQIKERAKSISQNIKNRIRQEFEANSGPIKINNPMDPLEQNKMLKKIFLNNPRKLMELESRTNDGMRMGLY